MKHLLVLLLTPRFFNTCFCLWAGSRKRRLAVGLLALLICVCVPKESSATQQPVLRTEPAIKPQIEVSYSPNYVPLTISVDSEGKISVKLSGKLKTPIGTFEISVGHPIAKVERENPNSLIVGMGSRAYVFGLDQGVNYKPTLDVNAAFNVRGLDLAGTRNNVKLFLDPAPTTSFSRLLQSIKPFEAPAPIQLRGINPAVSTEQRRQIIDFIVEADRAEAKARITNNPLFAAPYYAGEAYESLRAQLQKSQINGECRESRLNTANSYVTAIRYLTNSFSIEVDAVEAWSNTIYNLNTGRVIRTDLGKTVAQTITIRQTPQGWYVVKIQFH